MIALVTGGAGFIGSHLCERLIKRGVHVRCFDNLWRGKLENVTEIMNQPNFEFIKGDLLNFEDVMKATTDVDIIYHLGAIVGVKHCVENDYKSSK